MDGTISVGPNEAGFLITRSTLNRNGVYITSGLYDSGYQGVLAGVMHVTTAPIRIQQGTRVAQYLSFEADSVGLYTGSYGVGSEHDRKYD
jgi:deoxycytidine triphosphate deaminase